MQAEAASAEAAAGRLADAWNPYQQCSWPPEDVAIEKFRTHVKDTALDVSVQTWLVAKSSRPA